MGPLSHPRLRRAFFVFTVCLGLFSGLTAFVWSTPSPIDEHAVASLSGLRTYDGVAAARLATHLGDRRTVVLLTLIAGAGLLWFRRRAAAFLTISVAGAGILNTVVKWAVERPRPSVVPPVYAASGLSFPSGHSMASFALFFAIWLVARHERFRYAGAYLLVAVLVVPVVGFTRAYLGVHYPSDVLAGWALSGAWLALVYTWYVGHAPWADPNVCPPDEAPDRPEPLP